MDQVFAVYEVRLGEDDRLIGLFRLESSADHWIEVNVSRDEREWYEVRPIQVLP